VELALAPLANRRRVAAEILRADRRRPLAPEPPPSSPRPGIGDLVRDVRYAARVLARAPGFFAAAVATLALGVAANTTMFSVLNAVLLRPLPYADPSRLVYVGERNTANAPGNTGFATYADWKVLGRTFDDLAIIRSFAPTLGGEAEPERIAGMRVSANFFRLLGVRPALGRDFTPADDTPASWHVVLISDGLWRRRFRADPGIVARTIRMDDQDYQVIGVMPRGFEPLISEHFYQSADIWAALGYDPSLPYACRTCQHLKVLGRLKPGVSAAAAAADVTRIQSGLRARFPAEYTSGSVVAVRALDDEISGGLRPVLAALMGAVVFVLLIACANVANLLLARVARRQHELALRAALGASRARLVTQMLTESALIAAAACTIGVALAAVAVPLLVRVSPVTTSRLASARADGVAVAFGVAISMATTLLFGLVPALGGARLNLSGAIAGDARRTAVAPTSAARRLLVGAEIALAIVLLTGAGLMIRSVGRLLAVDPGFDPNGVLTMQISMSGARYREDAAVVRTGDAILDRLRAVPGVTEAALAGQIPLGGNGDMWGLHLVGRPPSPEDPAVERYSVTPGYFAAMRIPLVRGRLIDDRDRATSERVMVIGERTARLVWPNADPLGARVRIGGNDGPVYTVVGVAGDVRHRELAAPPTLQMYTAQRQLTDSFLAIVLRASGDPSALATSARQAVWAVAGDVPIYQVATLPELVAKSAGERRFVMQVLALFGGVALLMTAIGVYAVIAFSVSERTREIGVRAALGASRRAIASLVLGEAAPTIGAGIAAGLALALFAVRFLEGSLFEVRAADPVALAGAVALLIAVTLAAHGIPVLRATRVDPAVALRQE
jgi:putative ABC transport system permease protein